MNFTQSGAFANSGTISDGATIAASGVQLTNTASGRIYGGVTFTAGGSTLINELGGVVGLTQFQDVNTVLVTGSSGSDTVVNAGLISGAVALGGGADTFVDQDSLIYGNLDLGSGDDTYRIEGTQSRFISANGGDGQDRLIFAGSGQYWAGTVTGFEQLVFENGGNFENFSGFQSIALSGPFAAGMSTAVLINCFNPLADLTVDGQSVSLSGSSLRSITGGAAADFVELFRVASIAEGISLGGGDDTVILNSYFDPGAPTLTAPADGGSGSDTLMLHWWSTGDRTYDLSAVQGFEVLNVNAWYVADPATARVSNISNLTDIDVGQNVTLILSNSVSPTARAGGGFGGGVTLEAGTVIGGYARPPGWDDGFDAVQGDPAKSTSIVNHGTITGDLKFYIGDDYYDGRGGTVGGTIYGNAGNDTIIGGSGRETMVGGYGADVLTGGAGNDIFKDTAAGHNGDTIADFTRDDVIVISDAALAGFSFKLSSNVLTYTGGSLTLSNPSTAALQFSAAAGGGVQIAFASPPIVISGGAAVAPAIPLASKAVTIGASAQDVAGLSDDRESLPGSHAVWRPSLDNAPHWGGGHLAASLSDGDWLGQDIFQ